MADSEAEALLPIDSAEKAILWVSAKYGIPTSEARDRLMGGLLSHWVDQHMDEPRDFIVQALEEGSPKLDLQDLFDEIEDVVIQDANGDQSQIIEYLTDTVKEGGLDA